MIEKATHLNVRRSLRLLIRSLKLIRWVNVCRLTSCLLLTAYCVLSLTGCEEQPFQPLQENESAFFSMQGYLDAAADTQWVRIAPVRGQLAMPDVKPEMQVTLNGADEGEPVVMNDSLFQLPNGINYLNVWTTTEVRPESTYTLTAKLPDGTGSSVTVTIPESFPTPILLESRGGCTANLRIDGVKRLADVQSKWHIRFFFSGRSDDRFFNIPYRDQAYEIDPDSYTVFIDTYREVNRIEERLVFTPDSVHVLSRDIFVAAGGPEWIEGIGSLGDLVYALPEGLSNVENGVGYVIGIVSKTIPFNRCY